MSADVDVSVPVEARRSAGPDWGRVMALLRRQLIAQRRDPGYVFLLIALPVIDAVLFTTIGTAYGATPEAERVLYTGILLFHLIWQLALAGSLGFLEEVWSQNVLNLIATPVREMEYGLSLLLVGVLRAVFASTLIGVVGVTLYSIDPFGAGLVMIPAAIVLLLFGWAVSLMVVGLTLQYGESAEVFSWATLVLLLPISGVFYPVDALPGAIQAIARLVPITQAFAAVRAGLEGDAPVLGNLLWAGVGTAVVVGLSWWFVMRQLRRFRQEGWVSRFT